MRVGISRRYALAATLVIIATVRGGSQESGDPSSPAILVDRLDAPSFHTRRSAAQTLISTASSEKHTGRSDVTKALRHGLRHESLEVRIASGEILREIEQIRRDRQLDRLMNPRCQAATIDLAGWQAFASLAGDEMDARRLFAALFQRYPAELHELQLDEPSDRLKRLTITLDPYHLSPQDTVAWCMLLLVDSQCRKSFASHLAPRLGMALSQPTMGPKMPAQRDARVLQRMIRHWVLASGSNYPARERILIAMRYQCHAMAAAISAHVLADGSAAPATQVTALLCNAALGGSDIEIQARRRLEDDRTAHVWQLIASRKTKIRTQVRDVALAVLLRHHGIDPRQVGFNELRADPILVFTDHSLGFSDESSRQQAHQSAWKLLPGDAAQTNGAPPLAR